MPLVRITEATGPEHGNVKSLEQKDKLGIVAEKLKKQHAPWKSFRHSLMPALMNH